MKAYFQFPFCHIQLGYAVWLVVSVCAVLPARLDKTKEQPVHDVWIMQSVCLFGWSFYSYYVPHMYATRIWSDRKCVRTHTHNRANGKECCFVRIRLCNRTCKNAPAAKAPKCRQYALQLLFAIFNWYIVTIFTVVSKAFVLKSK